MRWRLVSCAIVAMVAASLVPASAMAAALPVPGSAAQVITRIVPISQADCQALADGDPQRSTAILSHCYRTQTITIGRLTPVANSSSGQTQAMAAGACAPYGYSTFTYLDDWGSWRIYVAAKYWVDVACNRVEWDWVTCDYSWVWPWTITQTWCGAYPKIGVFTYYTNTNVGINYVASSLFNGASHGDRWGVRPNPYGLYGVASW